jgi:hypothetical protein
MTITRTKPLSESKEVKEGSIRLGTREGRETAEGGEEEGE